MYKLVRTLSRSSSRIRRLSSRYFYQYVSTLDQNGQVTLMNYGYVDLDPGAQPIPLEAEDEFNRYPLQLYHKVSSAIDLRGLEVLEVGSGRGGGAAYVSRHLGPRSMTGMDLSVNAVAFSRRHHHSGNGLRYVQGDAEDLSFSDASFDAVINIESSHCYGEMAQFLREVHRVLRPGGHLLWADTIAPHRHDSLHQDIRRSGFEVVKEESITENVLEAMNLQKERNSELADRIAPWFARKVFYDFAGVKGTSYIYDFLQSGRLRYLYMVLRKAA